MANLFETETDISPVDAEKIPKPKIRSMQLNNSRKTLFFKDGLYQVKPLFKKAPNYKPHLNNYNTAESNCQSLRRRLRKDKSLEEQCKAEINKFIEEGDIEKLCKIPLVALDPKGQINYLSQ